MRILGESGSLSERAADPQVDDEIVLRGGHVAYKVIDIAVQDDETMELTVSRRDLRGVIVSTIHPSVWRDLVRLAACS